MQKFKIVLKIIGPLILGLAFIAVVSVMGLYILHKNNIQAEVIDTQKQTSKIMKHKINEEIKLFEGLVLLLQRDEVTQEYFLQKDREGLYSYLQDTYKTLNSKYRISHLYFHNLDKTNFLRVHDKTHHSDVIKRTTLDRAKETMKTSSGIEFGVYNNLTLRVVTPWFVRGKLIGYIELGKEIDNIIPELAVLMNADIILTLRKTTMTQQEYEKCISQEECKRKYRPLENFFIINSTLDNIGDELARSLDIKGKLYERSFENFGRKIYISSECFEDVTGAKIGKIFVVTNVDKQYNYMYMLIFKITVIVAILLALMIIYYFRYIKRTEVKLNEAHEQILSLSLKDGLTSLYNKRHFNNYVPTQIKRAYRCGNYLSFLVVDVDNFKLYNDTYGHLAGDEVLKKVAETIQQTFKRAHDETYRVGGEEFAIVTESDEQELGNVMAEKLRMNVEKLNIEHHGNGQKNIITVSIGVYTEKANKETTVNRLFNFADKAMYLSKENGRNKVTIYNEEIS